MNEVNVKFVDITKKVYRTHPILRAAAVEGAHKKTQIEKHGKETFVDCPGIFDYKNLGWILPAWDEFKVYCSDNATMAYAGSEKRPTATDIPCPVHQTSPSQMSAAITDGIPKGDVNAVKRLQPLHFNSPWTVIPEDDNISFLLMPPAYHSNMVDDFIVYPGVVDYTKKFGAINVIMSPRRTGTFTIKAGEPLLHIIPIQKGNYKATIAPQNFERQGVMASAKQFYRKYVMKRSKYTVEIKDD